MFPFLLPQQQLRSIRRNAVRYDRHQSKFSFIFYLLQTLLFNWEKSNFRYVSNKQTAPLGVCFWLLPIWPLVQNCAAVKL